eukprot:g3728.t1
MMLLLAAFWFPWDARALVRACWLRFCSFLISSLFAGAVLAAALPQIGGLLDQIEQKLEAKAAEANSEWETRKGEEESKTKEAIEEAERKFFLATSPTERGVRNTSAALKDTLADIKQTTGTLADHNKTLSQTRIRIKVLEDRLRKFRDDMDRTAAAQEAFQAIDKNFEQGEEKVLVDEHKAIEASPTTNPSNLAAAQDTMKIFREVRKALFKLVEVHEQDKKRAERERADLEERKKAREQGIHEATTAKISAETDKMKAENGINMTEITALRDALKVQKKVVEQAKKKADAELARQAAASAAKSKALEDQARATSEASNQYANELALQKRELDAKAEKLADDQKKLDSDKKKFKEDEQLASAMKQFQR